MIDVKLNNEGDIDVSALGDLSLTESIRQQILIRLRWIQGEWRLGPELGFSWFEDVLVKEPNLDNIRQLIQEEVTDVEGVEEAEVTDVTYDRKSRKATFRFFYSVGEDKFREEVTINV